MAKKVLLLAIVVFALASASVASAANGTGNGNGNTNKSANGAQTGSFNTTYNDGLGGTFTCSGERIAKTGSNSFTKDVEQCSISDPSSWLPQGRTVATPFFTIGAFTNLVWFSDFDGQIATSVTFVVSGGGPDGTAHMSIVAYY